ncbi:MAG TPA: hypothetical protein PK177_00035 [Burkholderiaceae bacterium]|nr:hypothetical protein [Burkholderiaceae bacterium]
MTNFGFRSARELALCATVAVAGCATLDLQERATEGAVPTVVDPARAPLKLAQMRFGEAATFEFCSTRCPTVTPKTIGPAATPHTSAGWPGAAPAPTSVSVPFLGASAALSLEARRAIDAKLRQAQQARRIVITSRADSATAGDVGTRVAKARAAAVRQYLQLRVPGLSAGRFEIAAVPASVDATPDRVEVVFIPGDA